jgi:hypothetical protein
MSELPKTLSLTSTVRRLLGDLLGLPYSKHAETVEATEEEAEIRIAIEMVVDKDLDATHRQTSALNVVHLVTGKYYGEILFNINPKFSLETKHWIGISGGKMGESKHLI